MNNTDNNVFGNSKLPPLFPKTFHSGSSNKERRHSDIKINPDDIYKVEWPDTDEIDMIVEVPSGSFIKYELDRLGNIRCDRILHTAMAYPGNYGYIPYTLSGDGDPTDIILLTEYPLQAGIYIKVRVIGVLLTEDEKGNDEKVLAVPCSKVDPHYDNIDDIDDLPSVVISKVKHFFEHYKDNEPEKWVIVKNFKNKDYALDLIKKHHYNYDIKYRSPTCET